MERAALSQLVEWKEKSDRKPLIVQGARQVGKTWLMTEFGKRYFKKTANFKQTENLTDLPLYAVAEIFNYI